jgi:23S rRNA (pseudouridine1915-N3)-methyltransferase
MVTFRIISIGKPPKDWRSDAFQHYRKLISPFAGIEEVFVKEQRVSESSGVEDALKREANSLMKVLANGGYRIALDRSGKQQSSVELARHLEGLFHRFSKYDLVIGGPHGLHESVLRTVDETVSFSHLTFPHDLARILLAEQLYRAMSILNNLPYHR